ncbi:NlpC/P60 family protein (plasmid) [Streptomyces sp. NBC_00536]|uniref:C40 family peptidase n=1 Tax=Streptomyces sp. NBC_00536 TaxID=2975769 RepID=UPI002E8215C4|nr:bifunctional lytic transglycosylase/C40 family peptidase [Streptomyces sp. NBC_00536]WUC84523.1 NlpC/P60 family protein [Streptomyces sp. NBC_00536]
MKWLVGIVLGVCGLMLACVGLIVMVVIDSDAHANEIGDGGGGLRGVPSEYRPWLFKASAACKDHRELTPALLASQLWNESKFKNTHDEATSDAGAKGPAQFVDGTWATYGRDDDGNGRNSPWDIGDAVMSQGRYMCSLLGDAKSSGFGGDPRALALAGYNAGWGAVERFRGVPPIWFARRPGQAEGETYGYVKAIMADIPKFQGGGLLEVSGNGSGPDAVRRAAARMGTPYSWGGGTPAGPSTGFCDGLNGYLNGQCSASSTVGFDCSSLVQYAYWPTTHLPRVASEQYGATSGRAVSRSELKPGDLLFWSKGGSGSIYHVAMYAGDGNVLHAPRTGRNVELQPLTSAMPESDYFGATRP